MPPIALDVYRIFRQYLLAVPALPLDKSRFTLDVSGVAGGIFGGDEGASAMAAVHVYENRKWLGWYNSPGSYPISSRFDLLAKSRFPKGFFPDSDVHTDPATLFGPGLESRKGPKFRATQSGTIIEETGQMAALFMQHCNALDSEGIFVGNRTTQAIDVTIAELNHVPASQMSPSRINRYSPVFASIPILVSIVTCGACLVFRDWYSFSSITLGILTSGICCLFIGSGEFMFNHPEAAEGCPPGDGILSSAEQVVLLRGAERAVNSITRGKFSLRFHSEAQYKNVGWCSILFTVQFIAQLVLIPQATLFGQIMFVASLSVSWIYNSWLSSLREKIQRNTLLGSVLGEPTLTKYTLGTRATMVVFVLLVLRPKELHKILDELLPNDTKVWREWKETILGQIRSRGDFRFTKTAWELNGFEPKERALLRDLYSDAQAAYDEASKMGQTSRYVPPPAQV